MSLHRKALLYIALAILGLIVASWVTTHAAAPLGPVQAVRNTNELAQLPNPLTKSTTTFVETQGTVGDGSASLWTWVLGATNAPDTNHVASATMPGAGMFIRNTPATGGGSGSSLWSDFGTFIAPTILPNSYRIGTNGVLQLGSVGHNYIDPGIIGPSFYMFSDQTNGDFAEIYSAVWSGTNEVSGWDSFGDHTEWDTWQNMPVGYGWHTGNSGTSLVFEGFRQFNPTNVVRYLRLEPTVADGATAVAYDYDTANALTTVGSLLARWKNQGTNSLIIRPDGELNVGADTINYLASGSVLSSAAVLSLSGVQDRGIILDEISDPGYWSEARSEIHSNFLFGNTNWPIASLSLNTSTNSYNAQWVVYASVNTASGIASHLEYAENGTNSYLLFQPNIGATNTPYRFDTPLVHTAGNLLEVANAGTNISYIAQNGALELGRSVIPIWNPDANDLMVGVHDTSVGDANGGYIVGLVTDNDPTTPHQADMTWHGVSDVGNGDLYSQLRINSKSGNIRTGQISITADVNSGSDIDIASWITNAVDHTPMVMFPDSPASGVAYKLGTSLATTNTIFTVSNAGTNVFSVLFDGSIKMGTNTLSISGTNLIVNGVTR